MLHHPTPAFGPPSPPPIDLAVFAGDADLLRLGEQLEAAWIIEAEAWGAFPDAKPTSDIERRLWDAAIAASDAAGAIVDQIDALNATTLAGLVVKARACAWTHDGEVIAADFLTEEPTTDVRLVTSLLRDVLAIDGRPFPRVLHQQVAS